MKWISSLMDRVKQLFGVKNASEPIRFPILKVKTHWTGYKKKEETRTMAYRSIYFSDDETKGLDEKLIIILDRIRHECGWAFVITSGYRKDDPLAHGDGDAVDVRLLDSRSKSEQRQKLHDVARKYKINRIGLYDKHVHFDISKRLPQNVTWIGVSK